jgi:hypothetical protein
VEYSLIICFAQAVALIDTQGVEFSTCPPLSEIQTPDIESLLLRLFAVRAELTSVYFRWKLPLQRVETAFGFSGVTMIDFPL